MSAITGYLAVAPAGLRTDQAGPLVLEKDSGPCQPLPIALLEQNDDRRERTAIFEAAFPSKFLELRLWFARQFRSPGSPKLSREQTSPGWRPQRSALGPFPLRREKLAFGGNASPASPLSVPWCWRITPSPKTSVEEPDPTGHGSGSFDLDQSAQTGAAHRSSMAGIDWTQAMGVATLVLSLAVICFVAFML